MSEAGDEEERQRQRVRPARDQELGQSPSWQCIKLAL